LGEQMDKEKLQKTAEQLLQKSLEVREIIETAFGGWRDRWAARYLVSQILADPTFTQKTKPAVDAFLDLMQA